MITDGYEEQIVPTKPRTLYTALMILGIVLVILSVFSFLFIGLGYEIVIIILGVVIIVAASSRRGCEFEYIMVNDDIEIARITAKQSRKNIYHFNNGEVKFFARFDSVYIDNEHQANNNIKILDFTSKNDENESNVYAFMLNKNNATEEVLLELSEKTLAHINNFFKGKMKE